MTVNDLIEVLMHEDGKATVYVYNYADEFVTPALSKVLGERNAVCIVAGSEVAP